MKKRQLSPWLSEVAQQPQGVPSRYMNITKYSFYLLTYSACKINILIKLFLQLVSSFPDFLLLFAFVIHSYYNPH